MENETMEQEVKESPDSVKSKQQRPKGKVLWYSLGIILLGVLGFGGWHLGKNVKTQNPNVKNTINTITEIPKEESDDLVPKDPLSIVGWKTYVHNELGFSVKYPPDWKVDESGLTNSQAKDVEITPPNPEPFISYFNAGLDGRQSANGLKNAVVFKNIDDVRSFYIKLQNDSVGNKYRYSEKEMTIGGQRAHAFLRSDLPNTREIYLFYGDYLYSIGTSKYDIDEVKQILSTFQFTK